jgi:prepilin-type N-terminal cleavage/methylation domain-containing protein
MKKMHNLRFSTYSSYGYTLVELLAVTSIIVIISGLIVGILYSTLRGGNKTRVTKDVAQNGNYALSVIANTALLSDSVTQVGGTPVTDCTVEKKGSSIGFEQLDGSEVTFSCDQIDAQTKSIASISATTKSYLIDNSTVKVDPSKECSFSCIQTNGPYDAPIISATFTISQRASTATFESVASSTFNTSVTMRNYNP